MRWPNVEVYRSVDEICAPPSILSTIERGRFHLPNPAAPGSARLDLGCMAADHLALLDPGMVNTGESGATCTTRYSGIVKLISRLTSQLVARQATFAIADYIIKSEPPMFHLQTAVEIASAHLQLMNVFMIADNESSLIIIARGFPQGGWRA